MTTTPSTTTVTPEAPASPEATPEPVTPDTAAEGRPAREAAKYRTQLRTVEAERDSLTGTVSALRQQIIEGIVEEQAGVSPAGVFAVNTVADFLSEDGQLDPAHIIEVARATAATLGLEQKPRTPKADHSQGPNPTGGAAPTWSDFLKKK